MAGKDMQPPRIILESQECDTETSPLSPSNVANNHGIRPRMTSWDSVLEDDDVFLAPPSSSPFYLQSPSTKRMMYGHFGKGNGRSDSGYSSHCVRSSTNSEPRLSVCHNIHSTRSASNIQVDSPNSNLAKLKQQQQGEEQQQQHQTNRVKKFTGFFTKHLNSNTGKTCSSNVSGVKHANRARVDDKPRNNRQPSAKKVKSGDNKNVDEDKEQISPIDTSTMLSALKLLQQRVDSGLFIPQEGQQITFGTCSVGFFDTKGGRLSIPNTDIVLVIPTGAIQCKGLQMVYIYALQNDRNEPDLNEKETWLTSTVECGPSGLQFTKDVLLSMPHSAINSSQWRVQIHRGNDSPGGLPEWKKLETGRSTIAFVNDKKVTLAINHFSPYKVSGRSSSTSSSSDSSDAEPPVSKWMKVALFPKSVDTSGEEKIVSFQMRICKLHDWKIVLQEECILDESKITSKLIPIMDNGDELSIHVKDVKSGWEIDTGIRQHIEYNSIWSNYQHAFRSGLLAVPIKLKSVSATDVISGQACAEPHKSSICVIEVSQTKENALVELRATIPTHFSNTEQTRTTPKKSAEDEICREMENRFLAKQPFLKPGSHCLCFLTDIRYRRICTALDGANSVNTGWSAFASAMHVGRDIQIQGSLEVWSRYQGRSPSAMLLDFFFEDNYNMDHIDTLRMLSGLFGDIENHIARVMVEEEIQERTNGVISCPLDPDVFAVEQPKGAFAATLPRCIKKPNNIYAGAKPKQTQTKWVNSFKSFITQAFKKNKQEKSVEPVVIRTTNTMTISRLHNTRNTQNYKQSKSLPRSEPMKDSIFNFNESETCDMMNTLPSSADVENDTFVSKCTSAGPRSPLCQQGSKESWMSSEFSISMTENDEISGLSETANNPKKKLRPCDSGVYSNFSYRGSSSESFPER